MARRVHAARTRLYFQEPRNTLRVSLVRVSFKFDVAFELDGAVVLLALVEQGCLFDVTSMRAVFSRSAHLSRRHSRRGTNSDQTWSLFTAVSATS
jgi:hypothetical protein